MLLRQRTQIAPSSAHTMLTLWRAKAVTGHAESEWLLPDETKCKREQCLLHELLHKCRILPSVEHRNVQKLWHVQEPVIVQECCLLLPCRSPRFYCNPATMEVRASATRNGTWRCTVLQSRDTMMQGDVADGGCTRVAYILMNTMKTRLCSSWSSSELAEFSVMASSCSLLH